jgi:hypothetical protein
MKSGDFSNWAKTAASSSYETIGKGTVYGAGIGGVLGGLSASEKVLLLNKKHPNAKVPSRIARKFVAGKTGVGARKGAIIGLTVGALANILK